jgi:glycerate dehydrogenase
MYQMDQKEVKMKIIFPDRATIDMNDINFSLVESCGYFTSFPETTAEEVFERCKDSDIIIANKVKMTRTVIDSLSKLKMISVIATGYNNVDTDYAFKKGITVCNVPGYAKHTVAQHTFALILNLATKACRYNADVSAGEWQCAPQFTLLKYPTFELNGKTLGIIGFGSIGKSVAHIADGFGMRIMYFDPNYLTDSMYTFVDLKTLLKESDIVTIHCPLTEKTRNLIGRNELSVMKSGAFIINTARGGIVNEEALAAALNNNIIAGAGVDVLSEEPPVNGNVLLSAKNCIITPHSAWSTIEARQTLVDETAENIRAFINGERRNVVN